MSCRNQQTQEIKIKIQNKYHWLSPSEVDTCYDKAVADYLRGKYPSDNKRPSIESIEFDFLTTAWVYARMEDILDRAGGTSLTAYRENGINLVYGGSYIDPALLSQIMPKGRVPR